MAKRIGFSRVRARSWDSLLDEAGFLKGDIIWVRQRGQQIHGIFLQKLNSRSQYTASVCFQYAWMPSFLQFSSPLDANKAHLLDCFLNGRVTSICEGTDCWYNMDAPPADLEADLIRLARKCVTVLDEVQQLWRDADWFLNEFPPARLWERVPSPPGIDSSAYPTCPAYVLAKPTGWHWHGLSLGFGLTLLAIRKGDIPLAQEYARFLAVQDHSDPSFEATKELMSKVGLAGHEIREPGAWTKGK